jgi:lysophospholipid acyltransferase
LLFASLFLIGQILAPIIYISSKDFTVLYLNQKIVLIWIAMASIRCKYYFGWTLATISFRFSGVDEYVWHKGNNVIPIKIELADSTRQILSSWNRCTNEWLTKCVYLRAKESRFQVLIQIILTNVVSSIWHGFFPGYYLTFLSGGFATYAYQLVSKNIWPLCKNNKNLRTLYIFISYISVCIILNTVALPFHIKTISQSIAVWREIYWIGHVLIFIGIASSFVLKFCADRVKFLARLLHCYDT